MSMLRYTLGGKWLLVEHRQITLNELNSAIQLVTDSKPDSKTDVECDELHHHAQDGGEEDAGEGVDDGVAVFRHEPFILSVECRDMEIAGKFLNLALAAGFRESGLNAVAKRIILSVR